MPPSSTQFHHSITRRRGSDQENPDGSRSLDDQAGVGQVLTYRQTRDRPTALDEINRTQDQTLQLQETLAVERFHQNRKHNMAEDEDPQCQMLLYLHVITDNRTCHIRLLEPTTHHLSSHAQRTCMKRQKHPGEPKVRSQQCLQLHHPPSGTNWRT
jgi:hypothetical protein